MRLATPGHGGSRWRILTKQRTDGAWKAVLYRRRFIFWLPIEGWFTETKAEAFSKAMARQKRLMQRLDNARVHEPENTYL